MLGFKLLLALRPVHTTAERNNMQTALAYAEQAACTSNVPLCICYCCTNTRSAAVLKHMRCNFADQFPKLRANCTIEQDAQVATRCFY